MPRTTARLAASLLLALSTSCSPHAKAPPKVDKPALGIGEVMEFNQIRHAKLWFAGEAGNWPLAAYEIGELREGFQTVANEPPPREDTAKLLSSMVPEYVDVPLDAVDTAVAAKDKAKFEAAFDQLTAGCNGCHKDASVGFNAIVRPTSPPLSNQAFAPR